MATTTILPGAGYFGQHDCVFCNKQFQRNTYGEQFCSTICEERFTVTLGEEEDRCRYCNDTFAVEDTVCAECYCFLIHCSSLEFDMQLEYLIQKYIKKYKLNEGVRQWDVEELAELCGSLHQTIKHRYTRRKVGMEKLNFLRWHVEYLRNRELS